MSKDIFVTMNQDRSVNRFEEWKIHRYAISTLILEAIQKFQKNPEVLIVGSGNCDDLDLQYLFNHTSLLHFVDIDHQATLNAIQNTVNFDGISNTWDVFECDITGLNSNRTFEQLQGFMKDEDTNSFMNAAEHVTEHIGKFVKPYGLLEAYDIVIILPIITQLTIPLSTTLPYQTQTNYDIFMKGITEIAGVLTIKMLDGTFSLTKKSGYFIVVSDVIEMTQALNFPLFFYENNQPKFSDAEGLMKCMFDALANGSTLIGAIEFFKWVDEHQEYYVVQKHWLWAFSSIKWYATIGYLFHNK